MVSNSGEIRILQNQSSPSLPASPTSVASSMTSSTWLASWVIEMTYSPKARGLISPCIFSMTLKTSSVSLLGSLNVAMSYSIPSHWLWISLESSSMRECSSRLS